MSATDVVNVSLKAERYLHKQERRGEGSEGVKRECLVSWEMKQRNQVDS